MDHFILSFWQLDRSVMQEGCDIPVDHALPIHSSVSIAISNALRPSRRAKSVVSEQRNLMSAVLRFYAWNIAPHPL